MPFHGVWHPPVSDLSVDLRGLLSIEHPASAGGALSPKRRASLRFSALSSASKEGRCRSGLWAADALKL